MLLVVSEENLHHLLELERLHLLARFRVRHRLVRGRDRGRVRAGAFQCKGGQVRSSRPGARCLRLRRRGGKAMERGASRGSSRAAVGLRSSPR